MKPVISIKEARAILGNDAIGMTDESIEELIVTLNLLAKDALELARKKIRRKKDAKILASLIYDIYQDKNNRDKMI